jgi:hypothetical protein
MTRAPSSTIFAPFVRSTKHVSDRQFERAEAPDFAAVIAHGIFSSMAVLQVTSPGILRSRRQWAGL